MGQEVQMYISRLGRKSVFSRGKSPGYQESSIEKVL